MTDSPSEAAEEQPAEADAAGDAEEAAEAPDPLVDFAAELAEAVGAEAHSSDFGTVKLRVARERWSEAVESARDFGLDFCCDLDPAADGSDGKREPS